MKVIKLFTPLAIVLLVLATSCVPTDTKDKDVVTEEVTLPEDELVVEEEELNYWFYGYDLSTRTEFPIARYDAIFGMGLQDFDGDIIVYYDM